MAAEEKTLTPMMKQYGEIKDRNPGTVLLYRMGDFYEMFNEDAKIASEVLGLTLTSRNHGGEDKTPLAGFPHHALDRYANRLVKAGHRIAICEQVEDPKAAKGIVKRDVIEVISAGTATEESFIDERSNNYIAAVCLRNEAVGLAVSDVSTGEFILHEITPGTVLEELTRVDPSEIVLSDSKEGDTVTALIKEHFPRMVITYLDGWKFDDDCAIDVIKKHFQVASIEGLGLEGAGVGVAASGALLSYLRDQKKNDLRHISRIVRPSTAGFADLDPSTIRNLELLAPLQTGDSDGTLISVLDKTGTSMGARLLRKQLLRPLLDISAIENRLDCVAWFKQDLFARSEVQLRLKSIADIERLIGKVTYERANARDLAALARSLAVFPSIVKVISGCQYPLIRDAVSSLEGFDALSERILAIIAEEPPLSLREGGLIRAGVSAELDELNDASINGKQWIAKLQETERQRTGINSIKVKYNKVFGYYIEISNANLAQVPDDYIRKQTLVNAERFVTPELKEMEVKILGAEERRGSLEYEIFCELRREVATHCAKIQQAADAIASLDVFISLARIAGDMNYCRPVLDMSTDMHIVDGRHPVVEKMNQSDQFVPNDTDIVRGESRILLITGPNMAGKSTYLRQNALIALMAQIGSFVPATSARIGLVDRFFTRIGASDRLARGQSTFLVEMIEVANILNNATDKSLVLLDEVGRGTSTFDGISIAWAVAETLHEKKGQQARVFFATHYHELTELSLMFPEIKNLHIKVKEWNDKIIFLRKIGEGSCDHSYGIQVARLAGIPQDVIARAREILFNLENMELTPEHKPVLARHRSEEKLPASKKPSDSVQLNIFDTSGMELVSRLQSLDLNSLTPLDALNILAELRQKALDS